MAILSPPLAARRLSKVDRAALFSVAAMAFNLLFAAAQVVPGALG
jgi:hypothetical protein